MTGGDTGSAAPAVDELVLSLDMPPVGRRLRRLATRLRAVLRRPPPPARSSDG